MFGKKAEDQKEFKELVKSKILVTTVPNVSLKSMLSLLFSGHKEFYNGNDIYVIICKNKREKICTKLYVKDNDIGFYDIKALKAEFNKEFNKEFELDEFFNSNIIHINTNTNSSSIRIYINL